MDSGDFDSMYQQWDDGGDRGGGFFQPEPAPAPAPDPYYPPIEQPVYTPPPLIFEDDCNCNGHSIDCTCSGFCLVNFKNLN